jgi:hypothetical protein
VLSLKDAAVLPPDVYLLVRGDVEEEVGILGSRVFRPWGAGNDIVSMTGLWALFFFDCRKKAMESLAIRSG